MTIESPNFESERTCSAPGRAHERRLDRVRDALLDLDRGRRLCRECFDEVTPARRLGVVAHRVEHHVLLGADAQRLGLGALAQGLRLSPAAREEVERLRRDREDVGVGAGHEVGGAGAPVLHPQVEGRVGEAAGGPGGPGGAVRLRAGSLGERGARPREAHGVGES